VKTDQESESVMMRLTTLRTTLVSFGIGSGLAPERKQKRDHPPIDRWVFSPSAEVTTGQRSFWGDRRQLYLFLRRLWFVLPYLGWDWKRGKREDSAAPNTFWAEFNEVASLSPGMVQTTCILGLHCSGYVCA
jgi:hypothetical protein